MASLIKSRIEKSIFKLEITGLTLDSNLTGEKIAIIIKINNEKNFFKKFSVWIYSKVFKKI